MSAQDYRVNAAVRRLLVSRWVDVSQLQIGTTNGVVYLLGHIDTNMEDPSRRQDRRDLTHGQRTVLLVMSLDKEIRRLRDVRDVVMMLDNVWRRGGRWRAADGTTMDSRQQRETKILVSHREQHDGIETLTELDDEGEGEESA